MLVFSQNRMDSLTTVVAAVLERQGRILICRRRADQLHPLKWEFPGGKVEPAETSEAALRRELREELVMEVNSAQEIVRYRYRYPGHEPVLLIFYRVESAGEPRNLIFEEIRWELKQNLLKFDFLEGDREFLRLLSGTAV